MGFPSLHSSQRVHTTNSKLTTHCQSSQPQSQDSPRRGRRASGAGSAAAAAGLAQNIDYSSLPDELTAPLPLSASAERKKAAAARYDQFMAETKLRLADAERELVRLAPNLRADERLDDVQVRLETSNKELEAQRSTAQAAAARLTVVREKRVRSFRETFDKVSKMVDRIYKDMTKSSQHPMGGAAYLTLENPDEPYLAGIK